LYSKGSFWCRAVGEECFSAVLAFFFDPEWAFYIDGGNEQTASFGTEVGFCFAMAWGNYQMITKKLQLVKVGFSFST
jgi:hypothetical protein